MIRSIYEDQRKFADIEREIPKEIEEMYVKSHGEEPSGQHILILPKISRK